MKKIKWTLSEDNYIKTNYPIQGPDLILPGRSRTSIKNRAQQLKVYVRDTYDKWSVAELEILKNEYPVLGYKVVDKLPTKSIKNIQITAHRLGIKKLKKHK